MTDWADDIAATLRNQEHAAQALRDERERCATIAETTEREGFGGGAYNEAGRDIAAAIRKQP